MIVQSTPVQDPSAAEQSVPVKDPSAAEQSAPVQDPSVPVPGYVLPVQNLLLRVSLVCTSFALNMTLLIIPVAFFRVIIVMSLLLSRCSWFF